MDKKHCKFCDKRGLLILPLRYAAVVEETGPADVPALPSTLGKNVSDLALSHGKYAPRLMREGYLYVLVDRLGIKYWEGYAVTDDAFLYRFPVDSPPSSKIEFTCDQTSCGIDASCIAVDKVDNVMQIYLLFTPSAMTLAKLEEYKANVDAFVAVGKMQSFNPKAWVRGGIRNQRHSLKPAQLPAHVPEWMLYGQCAAALTSPLGETMRRQMFPAINAAYAGVPAPSPDEPPPGRLGVCFGTRSNVREGRRFFVVFDHIGIAQELNNFRNSALEGRRRATLPATD